ncbi:MAG: hypothetical protein P1P69_10070, partial [Methanosarcinaceae archaeon]|nr:hypothetical protein [Methanosarcinaceae archaeon]
MIWQTNPATILHNKLGTLLLNYRVYIYIGKIEGLGNLPSFVTIVIMMTIDKVIKTVLFSMLLLLFVGNAFASENEIISLEDNE